MTDPNGHDPHKNAVDDECSYYGRCTGGKRVAQRVVDATRHLGQSYSRSRLTDEYSWANHDHGDMPGFWPTSVDTSDASVICNTGLSCQEAYNKMLDGKPLSDAIYTGLTYCLSHTADCAWHDDLGSSLRTLWSAVAFGSDGRLAETTNPDILSTGETYPSPSGPTEVNGITATFDPNPATKAATTGGRGPVLKGQAGVERSVLAAEARGETVIGREITMETSAGRTRPDLVVRDAQGNLKFIESKCGPSACLTPNQRAGFPLIESSGGIPRGANAGLAGLPPGEPIGPTPVQVDWWLP
jgi:hypothetical protein